MTSLVSLTAQNMGVYLEGILEIEDLSFPSPWSRNAFIQEIKNPVSHLWVLHEDDSVSGYMVFWMFDSEIQVVDIAVHPGKRGRGFGHLLLRRMIDLGVSKGIRYAWLEVRTSNLAARNLYEKLGFEKVGSRPRYYRDTNEDAIVMGLVLSEREGLRRASNLGR